MLADEVHVRLRFAVPLLVGAIAPALCLWLSSSSCSLGGIATGGAGGSSSSSSSGAGAGGQATTSSAGGATSSSSSSASAGGGGAGGAPLTCPDEMIEIVSVTSTKFCVDRLEVTNHAYLSFLAHAGMPKPGPNNLCAWNETYEPAVAPDAAPAMVPVLGVDWCDAYAYCKSRGKRLCGEISGGPLETGFLSVAGHDQWFAACSANDGAEYPYGTQDASLENCNDCDPDAGCDLYATRHPDAAAKVGSYETCEGGFPGLYDMSGNAWEWQDSCASDGRDENGDPDPSSDHCYRRGGGYDSPHLVVDGGQGQIVDRCLGCIECSSGRSLRRSRSMSTGIRCCLDLAP